MHVHIETATCAAHTRFGIEQVILLPPQPNVLPLRVHVTSEVRFVQASREQLQSTTMNRDCCRCIPQSRLPDRQW